MASSRSRSLTRSNILNFFPSWEWSSSTPRKLFCKIMSIRQLLKVTVIYRFKQPGKFARLFGVLDARYAQ